MSWNEDIFDLPENTNEEITEQEIQETQEQDEPKKRTMFQRAVLQTANSPQIGEYYGEIYNRYTCQYETHLIKVYEPQPNLYDGLKPAAVGSQAPGK